MNNTDIIIFLIVCIIVVLIIIINVNTITSPIKKNTTKMEQFNIVNVVNDILNTESAKKISTNSTKLVKNFRDDIKNAINIIDSNFNKTKDTIVANTNVSLQLKPQLQPHILPQQVPPETITVIENNSYFKNSEITHIEFPDDDEIINYDGRPQLDQSQTQQEQNCTNINDDYDLNITELYRKKQIYIKSYLEDQTVRGYNLDSYADTAPLLNTGLIKLDKEVNFPKPNGYIFESSPVYKR